VEDAYRYPDNTSTSMRDNFPRTSHATGAAREAGATTEPLVAVRIGKPTGSQMRWVGESFSTDAALFVEAELHGNGRGRVAQQELYRLPLR
jgi:hypothetical protein